MTLLEGDAHPAYLVNSDLHGEEWYEDQFLEAYYEIAHESKRKALMQEKERWHFFDDKKKHERRFMNL